MSNSLRGFRKGRGLTLDQLGRAVGLDVAHLSRIERGFARPSDAARAKLAAFFDAPAHVLFPKGPEDEEKRANG